MNYSLLVTPGFSESQAGHFDRVWRSHPDNPMLKTGVIKVFMDGVIETNTAYMLADYANTPSRGKPNYSVEDFNRIIQMMDRRGWQIMVHAHRRRRGTDDSRWIRAPGASKSRCPPVDAAIVSSISRPSIRPMCRASASSGSSLPCILAERLLSAQSRSRPARIRARSVGPQSRAGTGGAWLHVEKHFRCRAAR